MYCVNGTYGRLITDFSTFQNQVNKSVPFYIYSMCVRALVCTCNTDLSVAVKCYCMPTLFFLNAFIYINLVSVVIVAEAFVSYFNKIFSKPY
jgi:hypothetical protein